MSLFDELFAGSAAAPLLIQFGDERSVSVQLGELWLVRDATAMVGPQSSPQDDYGDMEIRKRVEMEVDLLVDETTLPDGGLEQITTAAKVDVTEPDGTVQRWNIKGIRNRSRTFVRLELFRSTAREQSVSGLRRQES